MRIAWLAHGLAVLALPFGIGGSPSASAETPASIKSRLQLFLDGSLLEKVEGIRLVIHPPVPREVALTFDAPWEGRQSGYVTVFRDEGRFRMYYRGGGDLTREYTCYAESKDGIHWIKPHLRLVDYQGSLQNNIIWTSPQWKAYGESHNFTPFRDTNPAAKPDQQYKAVALGRVVDPQGERRRCLVAMASPDGIVWKRLQEGPILTQGSFDSQNTAFWDVVHRKYLCFLRTSRHGFRSISRSTSSDFVHWTDPELLDFGETPPEHLYTNAIAPYFREPTIYLGFPMRFVPQRKTIGAEGRAIDGVSDGVLISSRDGLRWDRTFLEAFLRPGLAAENWGQAHGNNTPAFGLLPTSREEISFYWSENYGSAPHVRRGTLRLDGFVSVAAGYAGGSLVTKPLTFRGRRLVINYSTSAAGKIQAEMQTVEGELIPGYSVADCPEIYGDETERAVQWRSIPEVAALAGRPVRLRFVLKDADLYSCRFTE